MFLCARTSRRKRKLPVCQPRPLIQVDCKVLTLRGGRTNQDQSRACEFFSVASVQRHFDSGAASGLHIQVLCGPPRPRNSNWFLPSAVFTHVQKWLPTLSVLFSFDGAVSSIAAAKFPWTWTSFAQKQQPTPRDRELQRDPVCAADRVYSIDLRQ